MLTINEPLIKHVLLESGTKMHTKATVMSFKLSFGFKQELLAADCKESLESQLQLRLEKEKRKYPFRW